METFKPAILVIFGIWILVMALGFYGYGWEGLQAGLDVAQLSEDTRSTTQCIGCCSLGRRQL